MTPSYAAGSAAVKYLDWGVIQISVANLLIIAAMIVVFILALVLPFPGSRAERVEKDPADDQR